MLDQIEKSFKKSVCQEKAGQEKQPAVVHTVFHVKNVMLILFFFSIGDD